MSVPRSITLLCLAQMMTVILGFVWLTLRMKQHGYPDEPMVFQISSFAVYHWSSFALFLKKNGLFLLLLPVVWMIASLVSEARGKFGLSHDLWMILGVILPFLFIMSYFYASFHLFVAVPNP